MKLSMIFSEHRTRNIFFAFVSFISAFIVYSLTVAPTISFWDPAEYVAISHTLQVAHPPGSPFFAIWGRLVSMFMPPEHVALSINMISVTLSSCTIMLLYLIIVRLLEEWKGTVNQLDRLDQIGVYGGGLFGAITFTFTHTHWFNAVEAEMYASSMFFTALVVWMAMRWSANHDEVHSERWLVLIAYIFGLGIGVHLLNLLALFFVALIIYYKKRSNLTLLSFVAMGAVASLLFLLIYPFTIIHLPSLATEIERMTYGLVGPVFYLILVILAIIGGIWYTHSRSMRLSNIAMVGYAVIIIGYSTYALVLIRSIAAPPIDENDPSTIESFVSYLNRDQYGTTPLLSGYTYDNEANRISRDREVFFPRRHSPQPNHLEYYSRFESDWDFFWRYQVNHMYLRYFNWNFIGRESDIQDSAWYSGFKETPYSGNPANSGYFFLPLLFGFLGMLYHFRNDWKRASAVLALFLMTGLAIIVYLNQTPYEPRERDYAYVGSFFAFSIWIGMGFTALTELTRTLKENQIAAAGGLTALSFLAVPVWMAKENWPSHDRSHNYVARDYAYNLLNSVEENAILFTNGDNDTFPLWYLQEVEGIRTDVRVVNLSLLNTEWYIRQLRDRQTHESLPLPIRMNDEQLSETTSSLTLHKPREYVIPVNKGLLSAFFEEGVDPTSIDSITVDEVSLNQAKMATPYSLPVDSLDNTMRWYVEGRFAGQDNQGNPRYYLQVQDLMVIELIRNNLWLRPIYFANTVARDGQLNLQPWFQYEGKAFRLVPKRREDVGSFGYLDPEVHTDRLSSFRFEDWNHPEVYFDENVRRMMTNYRYAFTQLTDRLIQNGQLEYAAEWLRKGEDAIPFRSYESEWTLPSLYAYRYARVGEHDRAESLADFSQEQIFHWMEWDLSQLEEMERELDKLEADAEAARSEANAARYRRLTNRMDQTEERIDNTLNDLSFSVSQLTILQGAYYISGQDDKAEQLAIEVNLLTEGRIPIPSSREENRQQIERYNLGI
ncbi:MAG: DUF2723 domain-containing protein [Balneolaceae bacterium]